MRNSILLILALILNSGTTNSAPLSFNITIEGANVRDTIFLAYYKNVIDEQIPSDRKVLNFENGVFTAGIDNVNGLGYVSLYRLVNGQPMYYFRLYPCEPDDKIDICIRRDSTYMIKSLSAWTPVEFSDISISFSGHGSAKYNCFYERDRAISAYVTNGSRCDSTYKLSMKILDGYKGGITPEVYDVMKTDFLSVTESERIHNITFNSKHYAEELGMSKEEFLERNYNLIRNRIDSVSTFAGTNSANYLQMVTNNELLYGKAVKKQTINDIYFSLKSRLPDGETKDRILTYFAIKTFIKNKNGQDLLEDALKSVKTLYCKENLKLYYNQNSIGIEAYEFLLPDVNGKMVKLSDFKGKIVFIDFWYTGCGGCESYFQKVLSVVECRFKGCSDVVFVTINVDKDRDKWIKSVKSGEYTSPDVVNLNTAGKGTDHPIISNYRVMSYPRPIIIDKQGKILVNNYEELRSIEKITAIINSVL